MRVNRKKCNALDSNNNHIAITNTLKYIHTCIHISTYIIQLAVVKRYACANLLLLKKYTHIYKYFWLVGSQVVVAIVCLVA